MTKMKSKRGGPSSPYDESSKLLAKIWKTHKSIKSLAYDDKGQLTVSKQSYAIVCQVRQFENQICQAIDSVPKLDYNNKALVYILVFELILSERKSIRGGGALQRMVKRYESTFKEALSSVVNNHSADSTPRYVRINTCLKTPKEFISELSSHKEACPSLDKAVFVDPYVPNLLIVPPSASSSIQKVFGHAAIFQSQPSCFPAYCLSRYHTSGDVLDCCAAPGNKTTHVAALLPSATVFAWDRDPERFQLLQRRTTELSPGRIQAKNTDYLETTIPSSVTSILLDPSCSGNHDCDARRLESLATFQTAALEKAMQCDHVTTIVYSTCSVQSIENENVIATAMASNHGSLWQIVPAIPAWPTRGHAQSGLTPEQSACLLRLDREGDQRGFFVACLVRRRNRKVTDVDWTVPNEQSLPIYQGQSLAPPKPVTKPEEEKEKEEGETETKPVRKSDKKRAKKQAWKRRQSQSKKARLASQKLAATST